MVPLIIATVTTALARLLGLVWPPLESWAAAAAIGLAVMFGVTARAHFVEPRRTGMAFMVPPSLGKPELWVAVTGVLEAIGAIGLLVPPTRVAAAVCLALLLVLMFPANVRAATHLKGTPAVTMPLWARGLTQVWFVVLCAVVVLG